ESLDVICSASVVYLVIVDNTLSEYEDIRELAECTVKKALEGISNSNRRDKVLRILSQFWYVSCEMSAQKSDIIGFAILEMLRVSALSQLYVAMENVYKSVKDLNAIIALNM
ncbi:17252_t:CDS:2, partial [Cetraspora pellucida]